MRGRIEVYFDQSPRGWTAWKTSCNYRRLRSEVSGFESVRPALDLRMDQARDQIIGDDEEHIDAGIAGGETGNPGMAEHHCQNRDRAQAVNLRTVGQRRQSEALRLRLAMLRELHAQDALCRQTA